MMEKNSHDPFGSDEKEAAFFEWLETKKDLIAELKAEPREAIENAVLLLLWQYEEEMKARGTDLQFSRKALEEAYRWDAKWMAVIKHNSEVMTPALNAFYETMGKTQQWIEDQKKYEPAVDAMQKRNLELGFGRKEGVKARKDKAAARQALLFKAIDDLFAKPESPGWRWTNDVIADFLQPKFSMYRRSTILASVKQVAAKNRSEEKARQASKFLNR